MVHSARFSTGRPSRPHRAAPPESCPDAAVFHDARSCAAGRGQWEQPAPGSHGRAGAGPLSSEAQSFALVRPPVHPVQRPALGGPACGARMSEVGFGSLSGVDGGRGREGRRGRCLWRGRGDDAGRPGMEAPRRGCGKRGGWARKATSGIWGRGSCDGMAEEARSSPSLEPERVKVGRRPLFFYKWSPPWD